MGKTKCNCDLALCVISMYIIVFGVGYNPVCFKLHNDYVVINLMHFCSGTEKCSGDVLWSKCNSVSPTQNAIVSVKELCGLPPTASLKCLLDPVFSAHHQ